MRINNVLSVTYDYTYKEVCQQAALKRNYRIDYARTMDDALNMLLEKEYALVTIRADTVDYQNKLKVMKRLKPMPVLVVSYNTPQDSQDMVNPMKMGADFYIAAPFDLEYIIEIGFSLAKLYETGLYISKIPKFLSHEYLHVDIGRRAVLLKGNPIDLTQKEFDVLRLLMENEGDVLTHREIFKDVWGDEYADNAHNVLSCVIYRLKQKLEVESDTLNYIKSTRRVGYSFNPD